MGNIFHGLGWEWRRERVVRKWDQQMQAVMSIILAIKGRRNIGQCVEKKIGSNEPGLPIPSSLALL